MIRNLLVLNGHTPVTADSRFEKIFYPMGEVVDELAHLYSILKERDVEIILIPNDLPGINNTYIFKLRLLNPTADIWGISSGNVYPDDAKDFDGYLNINDGSSQIKKKIKRILYQKDLLNKYRIVGRSEKMKAIAETIDRIAPTDISALIVGESGSGKELVARAIHDNSSRSDGRFVAVNCGALSEGLLESELFGHERGAFTGSVGKRLGLFVQADKGTIFLDEIGETKPDMQVKLLRVLEDGYFYPVGGDKPAHSSARVVAATNRELSSAMSDGKFREDLYFRLGVVKIVLPSLIDRRGDILPLIDFFARKEGVKGFTDSAIEKLMSYDWPGNVRQLRNFISRMAAFYVDKEVTVDDVDQFIGEQGFAQRSLPVVTGKTVEEAGHELMYRALMQLGVEVKMLRELIMANLPRQTDFEENGEKSADINGEDNFEYNIDDMTDDANRNLKKMEKAMIELVLKETGGNRKEAARRLDIGERTLYRKLKEYDLS